MMFDYYNYYYYLAVGQSVAEWPCLGWLLMAVGDIQLVLSMAQSWDFMADWICERADRPFVRDGLVGGNSLSQPPLLLILQYLPQRQRECQTRAKTLLC